MEAPVPVPGPQDSFRGPPPGSLHQNPYSSYHQSSSRPSVASAFLSPPPPRVAKDTGLNPSKHHREMPIEEIVSNILKNPPAMGLENAFNKLGLVVSVEFVEDVLKLSYGAGMEALKFFRWAGLKLDRRHSPLSWNFLVDLLGKDKLFDAMWDCIKVMKAEGIVSIETISCVLNNYVQANKVGEATMTFEVMEQYGCPQDVFALNCLLSALCRNNKVKAAKEFFDSVKERITPNADTYALLLEGWESENNAVEASGTFGEMIVRIGWQPNNTSAYNAFLNTLVNVNEMNEALKFLAIMKTRKCFPDLGFFRNTFQILNQRKDANYASALCVFMTQSGIVPDVLTYNAMIGLCCSGNSSQLGLALRLLDDMVYNGAFPDFKTYNAIFEGLINVRMVEEASSIFREMTKNGFCPFYANYVMAIKMYFEADDPEMAVMMWRHMLQKGFTPKSDCAAIFIGGFCDLGRGVEALKYSLEVNTRRVEIPADTMTKLKNALKKAGKQDAYGHFENRNKGILSQPK